MLRGGLIVVAAAHAAAFAHGPLFPPRTLQARAAARLQLCAEQQAQADAQPLASGFISRRRVLEGAAGGVAISVAPQPAHAVKAGPKLDQFPEEEWQALVAQGKLSKVAKPAFYHIRAKLTKKEIPNAPKTFIDKHNQE